MCVEGHGWCAARQIHCAAAAALAFFFPVSPAFLAGSATSMTCVRQFRICARVSPRDCTSIMHIVFTFPHAYAHPFNLPPPTRFNAPRPQARCNHLAPAHVLLQHCGNPHRPISLLIIFQDGDERASHREPRAIERVHELVRRIFLVALFLVGLEARVHAPRLPVLACQISFVAHADRLLLVPFPCNCLSAPLFFFLCSFSTRPPSFRQTPHVSLFVATPGSPRSLSKTISRGTCPAPAATPRGHKSS